jgi:large subunit ribosomal protein L10e
VTGIPGLKISHFEMGDPNEEFDVRLDLISLQNIQLRHNALEAARQAANRHLEKKLGKHDYFLKIRVYPHHILRENKMATGAGADRVQSGMRGSFGKPIGKAARVKEGQVIMSVSVRKGKEDVAKEALRRANAKFPRSTRVETVSLVEA